MKAAQQSTVNHSYVANLVITSVVHSLKMQTTYFHTVTEMKLLEKIIKKKKIYIRVDWLLHALK